MREENPHFHPRGLLIPRTFLPLHAPADLTARKKCLECGADNVLLLGYKGADESMHLNSEQLGRLRAATSRMAGLRLRLDICWYPDLADLPHLFARSDCDAGDDFLVITPDRAVQACSFSNREIPFETFAELQQIYWNLRAERPHAQIRGCTRGRFSQLPVPTPERDMLWRWEARASNNSGDWTMLAQFPDAETAKNAAEILNKFFHDVHEYLKEYNRDHGLDSNTFWTALAHHEDVLPPPVQEFIEHYKLDVDTYDHGIKDDTDEPSIVALGKQLLMYHHYCFGPDTQLLHAFFDRISGGTVSAEVHYNHLGQFILKASAKGYDAEVEDRLLEFFTDPELPDGRASAPWTWDIDGWIDVEVDVGSVHDPNRGPFALEIDEHGLRLELALVGDIAVGSQLLERWLAEHGYREIVIECTAID